ncbi:hypothetical protein LCGC14_1163920 [marine sediment metagenome]|uniref:Terminase small subunit n=1 Tax=marine sediment metagenome TaxID=412755 RepID=A0A0F9PA37_9ZZZZ
MALSRTDAGRVGVGQADKQGLPGRRYKLDDVSIQVAFLEAYARTGNISASAKAAGVSTPTIGSYRDTHVEFKELFDAAYDEFCAKLEAAGLERAVEGIEVPVFYQGKQTDTQKRYSDRLLELYLKSHIVKYRDKVDVTHQVSIGVLVVPGVIMSVEKWQEQFGGMNLPTPEDEFALGDGGAGGIPALDNNDKVIDVTSSDNADSVSESLGSAAEEDVTDEPDTDE